MADISNQRLRIWLNFWKFFLGTFFLGFISFIVRNTFANRELIIKEQEHLSTYLDEALSEDVGRRRLLAEYFSSLTLSNQLRQGWERYLETVDAESQALEDFRAQLEGQINDLVERLSGDLTAEERREVNQALSEKQSALEEVNQSLDTASSNIRINRISRVVRVGVDSTLSPSEVSFCSDYINNLPLGIILTPESFSFLSTDRRSLVSFRAVSIVDCDDINSRTASILISRDSKLNLSPGISISEEQQSDVTFTYEHIVRDQSNLD